MSVPDAAVKLVEEFEGLRLTSYQCPAGIWTCGYGHTGIGVHPDMAITEEVADEWLRRDLEKAASAVEHMVKVPINDNQKSALISFVFNLGQGSFAGSTLLRLLNDGDYDGAAGQFPRWNKAGGQVLPGLVKRRAAEQSLFLTEVA